MKYTTSINCRTICISRNYVWCREIKLEASTINSLRSLDFERGILSCRISTEFDFIRFWNEICGGGLLIDGGYILQCESVCPFIFTPTRFLRKQNLDILVRYDCTVTKRSSYDINRILVIYFLTTVPNHVINNNDPIL